MIFNFNNCFDILMLVIKGVLEIFFNFCYINMNILFEDKFVFLVIIKKFKLL